MWILIFTHIHILLCIQFSHCRIAELQNRSIEPPQHCLPNTSFKHWHVWISICTAPDPFEMYLMVIVKICNSFPSHAANKHGTISDNLSYMRGGIQYRKFTGIWDLNLLMECTPTSCWGNSTMFNFYHVVNHYQQQQC